MNKILGRLAAQNPSKAKKSKNGKNFIILNLPPQA